jgi:hypothetical protein
VTQWRINLNQTIVPTNWAFIAIRYWGERKIADQFSKDKPASDDVPNESPAKMLL